MKLWVILYYILTIGHAEQNENPTLEAILKLTTPFPKNNPHEEEKLITTQDATNYLQKFGYLSPSNLVEKQGMEGNEEDMETILKNAILKFQEVSGLEKTGELDVKTKEKIMAPRCGMPDVAHLRSTIFKWRKNHVTYVILNDTPDLPRPVVRRAIKEAFNEWSAVTPLTFEEVEEDGDIKIKFAIGFHGDGDGFDGRGRVLAHAFYPEDGKLHFDDDEHWIYGDASFTSGYQDWYTDLFAVATHEIGHALGLDHSRGVEDIMYMYSSPNFDEDGHYIRPTLSDADIENIQDIYGTKSLPRSKDEPKKSGEIDWKAGTFDSRWSYGCEFIGQHVSNYGTDAETCIQLCYYHNLCYSFTWTPANRGTCFLKTFFEKSRASTAPEKYVCGGWFTRPE